MNEIIDSVSKSFTNFKNCHHGKTVVLILQSEYWPVGELLLHGRRRRDTVIRGGSTENTTLNFRYLKFRYINQIATLTWFYFDSDTPTPPPPHHWLIWPRFTHWPGHNFFYQIHCDTDLVFLVRLDVLGESIVESSTFMAVDLCMLMEAPCFTEIGSENEQLNVCLNTVLINPCVNDIVPATTSFQVESWSKMRNAQNIKRKAGFKSIR